MIALIALIVGGILVGCSGILAAWLIRRGFGLVPGAVTGAVVLVLLTPVAASAVQLASQYLKWRVNDQQVEELLKGSVIEGIREEREPERMTIYTVRRDDGLHELQRMAFDPRLRVKLTVVYSVIAFVTGLLFLGIGVGMMASRRT